MIITFHSAESIGVRSTLSGGDGGYYSVPADEFVTVSYRPVGVIRIYSDYEKKVLPAPLTTNNFTVEYQDRNPSFYNFTLAVPPASSLTVTPHNTHLKFDPPSVTINPPDKTATFIVAGDVAGSHTTWFELSGGDAPFTTPPSNVNFLISSTGLPQYKYDGASSSSQLQATAVGILLLSLIAILIL